MFILALREGSSHNHGRKGKKKEEWVFALHLQPVYGILTVTRPKREY
jgi:hypothetical protein